MLQCRQEAEQRVKRLAEQLRSLGVDPDSLNKIVSASALEAQAFPTGQESIGQIN